LIKKVPVLIHGRARGGTSRYRWIFRILSFIVVFQVPFEIGQSQLQHLRLSSVDSREVSGRIFPFFDRTSATRFLVIDTTSTIQEGGPAGLWVVDEFPLEIRLKRAIYPRPITRYRPLAELEPASLQGLYHFDGQQLLASNGELPEQFSAALKGGNGALRARGRELIQDIFFTLDLRRVTGASSRSGYFHRRRLEPAELRKFLADTD